MRTRLHVYNPRKGNTKGGVHLRFSTMPYEGRIPKCDLRTLNSNSHTIGLKKDPW
ncbi:hypothetical protein BCR34DRAFT_555588 [Clohesyomyces aquaticus]|uniref:Uncharacterized protein n=1 Tax=Clohesyomyces aquaticus TaxID=1231657 RepID=A0A1Y2A4T3_9PLEO|nr:hypothetical protein BCR34DRAFT_555588 [Clohesyomyces aquaticus]